MTLQEEFEGKEGSELWRIGERGFWKCAGRGGVPVRLLASYTPQRSTQVSQTPMLKA